MQPIIDRILSAVMATRARGILIQRKRFGVQWRGGRWCPSIDGCCALGALMLVEQPPFIEFMTNCEGHLEPHLNVPVDWLRGFQHGFDGNRPHTLATPSLAAGFAAGTAVAAEVFVEDDT